MQWIFNFKLTVRFSHKIITLDVAVYVANGLKDFFVIIFFSLQQHSRG